LIRSQVIGQFHPFQKLQSRLRRRFAKTQPTAVKEFHFRNHHRNMPVIYIGRARRNGSGSYRLGLVFKPTCAFKPGLHCIREAIGFLTGTSVHSHMGGQIPVSSDRSAANLLVADGSFWPWNSIKVSSAQVSGCASRGWFERAVRASLTPQLEKLPDFATRVRR